MKKILAIFAIISPLAAFASDFGFTVPEWSDFAPPAFIEVKEPRGLGKLNTTAKYWYKRKVTFETELDKCKALEANDERFNCYEKLKVEQYKENSEYNARLEAATAATVPGMENKTDNMIPLNSYFGSFSKFIPNELNN